MPATGVITLGVGPRATIGLLVLTGLGRPAVIAAPRPSVLVQDLIAPWIPWYPVGFRHEAAISWLHVLTMELIPQVRVGVHRRSVYISHQLVARPRQVMALRFIHTLQQERMLTVERVPSPWQEMEELTLLGMGDIAEILLSNSRLPVREEVVVVGTVHRIFRPQLNDYPEQNRCPQCRKLLERNKPVGMRWCSRCKMEVEC